MPDGQVVEMPDQLDPALGARLRAFQSKATTPTPAPTFGRTLQGEAEMAARGVGNVIPAAGNAVIDLISRATGFGPRPNTIPEFQPGKAEQELGQNVRNILPSTPNGLDVSDQELRETLDPSGKVPIEQLRSQYAAERGKPLAQTLHEQGTVGGDIAGNVLEVGQDVAAAAPGAALARGGARAVAGAVERAGAKAAEPDLAAGFRRADSSVGKAMAGSSAGPTLVAHNAAIGNTVIGSEAGLAAGTTPSYEALAEARKAPSAVFDKVAQAIPDGPLNDKAQAAVKTAGLPEGGRVSQGSPQAQQQIETLRQQLLAPARPDGTAWNGQNWMNELRALRQEGYANIGSEDVSNQQLGRAQLDMARAVEGHIGDSIPANANVNLEQFQSARKALAKNWTAQGTLRGDTFDLRALARVQRADPTLLDGGMKTAADFANSNPEVVGIPSALQAPNVVKDVAGVSLAHPATWLQPFLGGLGRRVLTGGPGVLDRTNAIFSARPKPPVPAGGLGDEFQP